MAIRRLLPRRIGTVAAFCACALLLGASSRAQDSHGDVADSLAHVPTDSLAPVLPDSFAGAVSDSTLSPFASADSTGQATPAPVPRLDPWNPEAAVDRRQLDWLRPESLVEALAVLPGANTRVAGDHGMPAFVSLSPVDAGAPEIWVDGVPGGDLVGSSSALHDHGVHAVARLGSSWSEPGEAAGDPHLEVESLGAVPGRTLLDSQFSRARRESYMRAVRVSTAEAARVLQFDFEEWKTDEGILFAPLPQGGSAGLDGRTKMRRFRLRSAAETSAGRVLFEFGRGRRLWPTSVLNETPTERWTGLFAVGIDRQTDDARWRLRAWHRDVHEDDGAHFSVADAARLGLRVERRSRGPHGWRFAAWVERWSGSFADADTTLRPDPTLVSRASVGLREGIGEGWEAWARLEGATAEASSEDLAVGGGGGLRRELGRDGWVEALAQRQLRAPTLLETGGFEELDLVLPTASGFSRTDALTLRREAAGELPFERQDRVALRAGGRFAGLRWTGGVEHWRLREGIGWVRVDDELARTVGGLQLDVDQVVGQVDGAWWRGKWQWRVLGRAHRVIGTLERDASRGAGWPTYASKSRVGVDREFFSPHNRLGFDVDFEVLGPRYDDLAAALGGAELDVVTRLDLRARLSIRDAEMALCLDNALDSDQAEVLGSLGRPRQIRWTLSWPFFN